MIASKNPGNGLTVCTVCLVSFLGVFLSGVLLGTDRRIDSCPIPPKTNLSSLKLTRLKTGNCWYANKLLVFPLVLFLTGSSNSQRPVAPPTAWEDPVFQVFKDRARQFHKTGKFLQAAAQYQAGADLAKQRHDAVAAARFLNNLGAIRLAVLDFRSAVEANQEALRIAETIHEERTIRSAQLMLASVYLQHGDLDSASRAASKAVAKLAGDEKARYVSNVFNQLGQIEARKGNWPLAEKYFHKAIAAAVVDGDLVLEAFSWDQMGYERMEAGFLDEAETALLKALQLRKQAQGAELCLSFNKVGILRARQGRSEEAIRWLTSAVQCPALTSMQSWIVLHMRGLAYQSLGKYDLALADLRRAIGFIRHWKLQVIPVDGLRAAAESDLQAVYDSYLSIITREAIRTGNLKLIWESFLTAQENHAWSFRELKRHPAANLPEEYFETIAQFRNTESLMASKGQSQALNSQAAGQRFRLREMEVKAGLENLIVSEEPPQFVQQKLQRGMRPDEALVSFHIAAQGSCIWVLTSNSISIYPLIDQAKLAGQIDTFVESVRLDKGYLPAGMPLAASLFGGAQTTLKTKKNWVLILDRELFAVPFAALPFGQNGQFLVEQHTLRIVPGILLGGDLRANSSQGFLGVADAIYNRADDRFKAGSQPVKSITPLPRLPATAAELARCVKAFQPDGLVQLLQGANVSPNQLRAALEKNPQVIHIAAHFVKKALPQMESALVLSLNAKGVPDLVTPNEAATFETSAKLVTLNGCGSGDGPGRAGSGLMGLTRAWLAAGAQTTIASYWPTPDDSGEMFVRLYEKIGQKKNTMTSESIAEALRQAQLGCLRSQSFRNRPKYWSAFFVVGKG